MSRRLLIGLLMVVTSLWIHCGGGRKLATETRPLGFYPFLSENLSPEPELLNEQLQRALITSGSFTLVPLASRPTLADIPMLQQITDTSLTYILTGRFLREEQVTTGGKHIPMVAYLPRTEVKVKAEILLYNREKGGWQLIREVEGIASKKGSMQVAGMDRDAPDLQLSAPEYARLQQQAYQNLFFNIIEILEKAMEIPKE